MQRVQAVEPYADPLHADQGLLLRECGAALCAGVNLMLLAGTTAAICQLHTNGRASAACTDTCGHLSAAGAAHNQSRIGSMQ